MSVYVSYSIKDFISFGGIISVEETKTSNLLQSRKEGTKGGKLSINPGYQSNSVMYYYHQLVQNVCLIM